MLNSIKKIDSLYIGMLEMYIGMLEMSCPRVYKALFQKEKDSSSQLS